MKSALILTLSVAFAAAASADSLNSAKITQAIQDVKVYRGKTEGRAATIGDKIDGSSSVTTGRRSRAELTFQDNTLTRLGQNSIFSFRNGSREVELKQGSILLQVPKNAGGATIRAATVTAAITGTTSMFEYSPGQWVKLLTLEGKQKLFIKGKKDPIEVPAGEMIIVSLEGDMKIMKVTIDIKKLLKTSALTDPKNFDDLPKGASDAIAETVEEQQEDKSDGRYLPTKKVVAGPNSRGPDAANDGRNVNDDGNYRYQPPILD